MARLRTAVNNIIAQKVETVQVEIAAQKTMSHAELTGHWRQVFGTEAPHNLSKRLLIHALAYRIQAQAHGGLKKAAKQMLADAVSTLRQNAALQSSAAITQSDRPSAGAGAGVTPTLSALPQENTVAANCLPQSPARTPPPAITLSPGTRLMREWRGVVHVVDRTEDGFMWNGKVYRSLSAIARAITGVRWNGLAFFGLRKRKDDPSNRIDNISSEAFTKGTSQAFDLDRPATPNSHTSPIDHPATAIAFTASPPPSPTTDPGP